MNPFGLFIGFIIGLCVIALIVLISRTVKYFKRKE